MTAPCPSCPWRVSSTVGGGDIPGFSIDLMRSLSNTVGPDDGFRPVMACHGSPEGGDRPCVGYLAVEGWSNLAVRVMAIQGRVDMHAVDEGSAGLELWGSFGEMLAAYEAPQPG